MKKIILLLLLNIFLFATNVSNFINKHQCDQIIDKKVYTICYSYKYKGALAVWYKLHGNLISNFIKKRPKFYSEKTIPLVYRSKPRDYLNSGYDRGHLASDASFSYNKKIVRKTYSMANIIPQAPQINRKTWIKAERLERRVAISIGSVNVLNGVVYGHNPKRIGKNHIAIPKAFWKMIYNDKKGYRKCFYYKNDLNLDTKGDKLKKHLINCKNLVNQGRP